MAGGAAAGAGGVAAAAAAGGVLLRVRVSRGGVRSRDLSLLKRCSIVISLVSNDRIV